MLGKAANFLKYRYGVCFVTLFVIGISASVFGGFGLSGSRTFWCFLAAGLLCLIIAVLLSLMKKPRFASAAVCAVYLGALLLGFGSPSAFYISKTKDFDKLSGKEAEISCRIISDTAPSASGKSITAEVRPDKVTVEGEEIKINSKIFVTLPLGTEAKRGDGIYIKGRLNPPETGGGRDYRLYRLGRRSFWTLFAESAKKTELPLSPWDRITKITAGVREKIFEFCDTAFSDKEASALLKGILTGSREDFSDEFYDNMSNSGFMHIAAVSGLHIGFLCGFVFFILKIFQRKTRALFAVPILLGYMAVADFTPSVVRAVIMTCLVLASYFFEKTPDLITSLFVSAFIQCLINPFTVANVGFLMSYGATLSLVLFMPALDPILRKISSEAANLFGKIKRPGGKPLLNDKLTDILRRLCLAFLTSLAVSLVCQLGIMPISLHYFGKASVLSFVGNIAVVPCTMVVFVTGLICAALFSLAPKPAALLSCVAVYPFLKIIILLANTFSKFSYEPMYKPGFFVALICYALAFLLLNFLTNFSKKFTSPSKSAEKP